MMDDASNSSLGWQLLQTLESLQQAGVLELPKAAPRDKVPELQRSTADVTPVTRERPLPSPPLPVAPAATPATERTSEPPTLQPPAAPLPTQPTPTEPAPAPADVVLAESSAPEEAVQLEVVRNEVAGCTRCQELADSRKQTVFGVGNASARLCFLGEAPGAEEDRQGIPFVGPAGDLLNKILAACHLSRDDVYILNVLKCRPPGNRNPLPQEAENCRGFLDQQLAIVDPEFICCLGAVAAQNLLGTTQAIGRLRGRVHDYRGIKVVCTYHPAYLLRDPAAKKHTWDDIQFLMREMGTPIR